MLFGTMGAPKNQPHEEKSAFKPQRRYLQSIMSADNIPGRDSTLVGLQSDE